MKTISIFLSVILFSVLAQARSAKEVKEKAAETADAAVEFTQEQKDAFVTELNQKISDIKKEIAELKASANKEKDAKIKALEKKQAAIESDLGELKKSSGQAWMKLKSGISKAWTTLSESVSEAKKEITKK